MSPTSSSVSSWPRSTPLISAPMSPATRRAWTCEERSGAGFLGQGHDADASWTTVLKRESNWLAASICLGMIWAS